MFVGTIDDDQLGRRGQEMSTDDDPMWHTGLQARLVTSFPKRCPNCGRIFETVEQYFTETHDIKANDRGLKSFVDEDTTIVVEAFRNCPCGSTLMEMFEDSDDNRPDEIMRRKRKKEQIAKAIKVEVPTAEGVSSSLFGVKTGMHKILDFGNKPAAVEGKWGDAWYDGLRPKGMSAFPKKCRTCDRIFETPEDFFSETISIKEAETGLRECMDEEDQVMVEAYRNCPCGSTLMDNFSDRRDASEAGIERRERFNKMLNYLVQSGLDANVADTELLEVVRGGKSEILSKIKPPDDDRVIGEEDE